MSIWVEMLFNARFVQTSSPRSDCSSGAKLIWAHLLLMLLENVSSSQKVNIYRQFQSSRFNFSDKPYVVGTQKNRLSESSFRAQSKSGTDNSSRIQITLSLLAATFVVAADIYLCKQFGLDQDWQNVSPDLDPKSLAH